MYSEVLHSLTLENRWNTCFQQPEKEQNLRKVSFYIYEGSLSPPETGLASLSPTFTKHCLNWSAISAFLTKISLFNTILVAQVCPLILGHISVPINFEANFRLYCRGQNVCIFASCFQLVEFIWIHLTFIPFLSFIGKQRNFIHFC